MVRNLIIFGSIIAVQTSIVCLAADPPITPRAPAPSERKVGKLATTLSVEKIAAHKRDSAVNHSRGTEKKAQVRKLDLKTKSGGTLSRGINAEDAGIMRSESSTHLNSSFHADRIALPKGAQMLNFEPNRMPSSFDPNRTPSGFDPNRPPNFDPNRRPPGFDANGRPPHFDSNRLPPNFDPSKPPPNFD